MDNENLLVGSAVAIGITILSVILGFAPLLFFSWIAGAITIVYLLGSSGDFSILHKIVMPAGTILIIALTFVAFVNIPTYNTTIKQHEIYSVTRPFGVIWVEQTGEISGGVLSFSGSMDSQLVNSYIAKYMDGNQLKTVVTNNPLVIDGNFTLEEKITTPYYQNIFFYNTHWPANSTTKWVIHIPSLPSTNQTDGDYHIVP